MPPTRSRRKTAQCRRRASRTGSRGSEARHRAGSNGHGRSASPIGTTYDSGMAKTKASRADKYALYQRSVQEPEADVDFVVERFEAHFHRRPRTLREDFCGAAAIACEWVRSGKQRRAWGVDIDPEPLAWGRRHNLSRLTKKQSARLKLMQQDVLVAKHRPVDVVIALNFSYFLFRERDRLLRYFRACLGNLDEHGLLVLDAYGGPDTQRSLEEITEHDDFDYVWDQDTFDPINNIARCFIHFRFDDDSSLDRAFEYRWRLWSLPEIRELILEAGFAEAEVYWEGTDEETGEGDGVYTLQETAENDDAWVSYVVGVKR